MDMKIEFSSTASSVPKYSGDANHNRHLECSHSRLSFLFTYILLNGEFLSTEVDCTLDC
jgi:hypothetical protein